MNTTVRRALWVVLLLLCLGLVFLALRGVLAVGAVPISAAPTLSATASATPSPSSSARPTPSPAPTATPTPSSAAPTSEAAVPMHRSCRRPRSRGHVALPADRAAAAVPVSSSSAAVA